MSNNGAIALGFGTGAVDALFFDGEQQATGTWGKTGSGADHINDTYFTGSGVLTVVPPVPTPNFQTDHAISLDKASGYATLTLEATNGIQYRVVHKDDLLASGEWRAIRPPEPNGWTNSVGPTITLTDTNAAGVQQRFYRIEAKSVDAL